MTKSATISPIVHRRGFLLGSLTLALGGCVSARTPAPQAALAPAIPPDVVARYGPVTTEKFPIAGVNPSVLKPQYVRQVVDFPTSEKPGTLVVDPHQRFLYLVMENGEALRYGVGVGKEGLEFAGTADVGRKAQWPGWTPTPDMIRREPDRYGPWAKGMEGGAQNPLGARALYLFKDGRDTLYRIHGTTEPATIGKAVSSGCIRMMNQDVIDLYGRVPTGARVVVL